MLTQISQNKNINYNALITQNRIKRSMPYTLCSTLSFVSLSPCLLVSLFTLLLLFSPLFSLEIPLDFHGSGSLGKYLNSNSTRYNMDASVELYCTMVSHDNFSFFIHFQDDLDMAEQTGGVALDPRYAHYYISGGFDYIIKNFFFSGYFMHDCIHDIDYDVEGTPVFNRFRFKAASSEFHTSRHLLTSQRLLWSIDLGLYPHWQYHGFDINSGTDYKYDVIVNLLFNVLRRKNFGIDFHPMFQITKGDTSFYHQHIARLSTYYRNNSKRIGIELDYNIINNDPIKNPEKLWFLSIFAKF